MWQLLSDVDDPTSSAGSIGERISHVKKHVKKAVKAKRLCKQGVLMNTEFRYKGPTREVGFRYVGREWGFLAVLILLEILFVSVIVDKVDVTSVVRTLVEILMSIARL